MSLLRLVITSQNYPQRTAFKLLSEARAEFEKEFKTELAQAKNSGLSKIAKPFLKRIMDRFEDVARADKITNVSLQVEQVKGVMQNNIQAALKVWNEFLASVIIAKYFSQHEARIERIRAI